MQKVTDKNKVMRIALLFMFLYMVSYLTRINYGAVISEMVTAEKIQKSAASLALSASAVTYGVGQLLSGFLGDKVNPKKLVFSGLIVTISMNLLIPFVNSVYMRMAVWGVNGLAQAFMWPPLVKLMTSLFTEDDYKKSCVIVSWGSSLGTIAVYLLSPLCIAVAGWKTIFIFSALCAIVMAVVWMKKCPQIDMEAEINKSQKQQQKQGGFPLTAVIIIAVIILIITLQGILRDGVKTWMPSYVAETFNLSNKIAILTGIILPLFSIAIIQMTSIIYRKLVKNELLLTGIMGLVGFAAAMILYFGNGVSSVLSVVMAAVLTGCMNGENLMITSMVPPHFAKYGRISFVSGIVNFGSYIGSAISGVGLAAFSENYGWTNTLLLWGGVALTGGIIAMILSVFWKSFVTVSSTK